MLEEVVIGKDEAFILGTVAAGIVGGCATLLGAYSIEKFGGVVGGITGTIPLTVIPFIVGLLLFENTERVDLTLNMVPVGMLDTMIVLLMWRFFPPHLSRKFSSGQRLLAMLLLSFFLWALLASGLVVVLITIESSEWGSRFAQLASRIAGGVALGVYLFFCLLIVGIPKLPVGRKGDERVKGWHHLARFAVGSITTSIATIVAKYNTEAGGISIAFPAVSLTALSSLWIIHCDTVAMSAAAPMIVGSASTSIFSIIFAWVAPILAAEYGKIGGLVVTFASVWFLVIFIYSLPVVVLLRRKEIHDHEYVEKVILPSNETEEFISSSPYTIITSVDEEDENQDFADFSSIN